MPDQYAEQSDNIDRLAESLAQHPAFVDRRRSAIRFALAWAAIVAGIIALAIGRWISLDPINDGIRDANHTCEVRIDNIAGTAEFRADYKDTLQDLASYFRDDGNNRAALELDARASQITPPEPAGCDPNRPEVGFFG